MPSTTARGIPYPLSGETADGPGAFSAMATKLDSLLDAVWALLNAGTSAASAGTLVERDAGGNFSSAAPTAADHVVTKTYADGITSNLNALLNNRIRAGVATVTTNANGDFTINFTSAFPSTLVSCTMTDATATTQLGGIILKSTAGSSSKAAATGRAYATSGTALTNTAISINYTAIGY